jgi:hypothetical protein
MSIFVKALQALIAFPLCFSAALVATIGLFVQENGAKPTRPIRRAVGLIAVLTVILGNVWWFWTFFLSSKWHGFDFVAYQRLCRLGVDGTLLTVPIALLGRGPRRAFSIGARPSNQ